MKNMVVFLHPGKQFYGEYAPLVKVWVDNSLDLGWKVDDLLLVTNFPYDYNGVSAVEIPDGHFYRHRALSLKTSVLPYLIEQEIIEPDRLYWNHDLDAFQLNPFDLWLSEGIDLALTDYGWRSRWCMGSYFFKRSARDILDAAARLIISNTNDEDAFLRIEESDFNKFSRRHSRLNVTYNFGMRKVHTNWQRAERPLKVVHFHPRHPHYPTWDIFVNGNNAMKQPIVNNRLLEVFKHHGIS